MEKRESNVYDDIEINQMTDDAANTESMRPNLYDYPEDVRPSSFRDDSDNIVHPPPNDGDYTEVDETHNAEHTDNH